MVTIIITPKLGPYGSGPEYVGVDVRINLTPEVETEDWETIRRLLNRTFIIEVPKSGQPNVSTPSSKK